MERYAVMILKVDGSVAYEAIGVGQTPDQQHAHLYTTIDLAKKKVEQYTKNKQMKQWYKNAWVVPVQVVWPTS